MRIVINDPAVPDRPSGDLRTEVARRSSRYRRRRRIQAMVLSGTALAAAAGLFAVTVAPPTDVETFNPATDSPSDEHRADDDVETSEASEGSEGGGAVASDGSVGGRAPVGRGRGSDAQQEAASPQASVAAASVLFTRSAALYEASPGGSLRKLMSGVGADMRLSPHGTAAVAPINRDLILYDLAASTSGVAFDGSDSDTASAPAWMPDGTTVLFVRTTGLLQRRSALWTLDTADGTLREIRAVEGAAVTPSVASDGRIAYQCTVDGEAHLCFTDRTRADRGAVRTHEHLGVVEFSPDGRWIAATAWASGTRSTGLVVIRPDGSDRRIVVADRVVSRPAWFPDGSRLAFELLAPDNPAPVDRAQCTARPCTDDAGIWSVRIDGSDIRQVTTGAYDSLGDVRGL